MNTKNYAFDAKCTSINTKIKSPDYWDFDFCIYILFEFFKIGLLVSIIHVSF